MRYKYFYEPNRDHCPICGRPLIDFESMKSFFHNEGLGENESEFIGTKVCIKCGQPVHYKQVDSDYLYLYISRFIGWQGLSPMVIISINQKSGECLGTIFNGNYCDLELDNNFKTWLKNNIDSLLNYSPNKDENDWFDVDEYYLTIINNNTKKHISVQSPYIDNHPLIKKIFNQVKAYLK